MQHYLHGAGSASRFFDSDPGDLDAFRARLDEVRRRFGPEERRRAAAALSPTSERARRRLETFVRDGGAMVTTGQQSGLFTGPLFTIHKALTAVRLAASLESRLGIIVLPVFWNASEDHDWDEVNHTFLWGGDDVHRIALPPGPPGAIPMSDRLLDHGIEATLDAVAQVVYGQPYADRYLSLLRGAYRPGVTVAGAFQAVLAELLAPFDLLITDAADPALKRASAPVLARALEDAVRHGSVLAERTEALVEAGYHAQVPILEGATNVFYHGRGERERLHLEAGVLRGPETGARLTVGEAVDRIGEAPGEFSPNVFLRPVVESAVFPTLAYVGGPGEMAYFGQLTPLFEEFGMRAPVVYPRASVLLVEEGLDERLSALGFGIGELSRPRHELVEDMALRSMSPAVRAALDRLSREVSGGYRDLIDAAIEVDPTLAGALGSVRNDSLSRIGRAERKILRRLKALEPERARELDRVRARLAPGGQPQERVLNVIGFLAAVGPGLLESIAGAIETPWEAAVR